VREINEELVKALEGVMSDPSRRELLADTVMPIRAAIAKAKE
jgi:hypothetical protein